MNLLTLTKAAFLEGEEGSQGVGDLALGYYEINLQMSKGKKNEYLNHLIEAISDIRIASAKFETNREGNVHFRVNDNSNKAVGFVIAFDKKQR